MLAVRTLHPLIASAAVTCRNLRYIYCVCSFLQSGDIFQLVLSQRYERRTFADI
jgi:hypothetical protein